MSALEQLQTLRAQLARTQLRRSHVRQHLARLEKESLAIQIKIERLEIDLHKATLAATPIYYECEQQQQQQCCESTAERSLSHIPASRLGRQPCPPASPIDWSSCDQLGAELRRARLAAQEEERTQSANRAADHQGGEGHGYSSQHPS